MMIICTLSSFFNFSHAQRFTDAEFDQSEEITYKANISLVTATTLVPAGQSNNGFIFVPSYGIDFAYFLSERFGMGIFSDIELLSYVVETSDNEILDREFPIILSSVLIFKPSPKWAIVYGPGFELERNKRFFVNRFGLEYEIDILKEGWEMSIGATYENKQLLFDAWELGVTIGKNFR